MVTFAFELRADAALMPSALDELRPTLPSDVSIISKTQTAVATLRVVPPVAHKDCCAPLKGLAHHNLNTSNPKAMNADLGPGVRTVLAEGDVAGKPFNIASYALLTHMLAQQCELEVGDFIWTGGDCHLYNNHFEQVETQLARSPFPYPQLQIRRRPGSIFDYQLEDFEVVGYQHHPAIKAPVAV